ncbi:MAG TPA: DEAD/DEAH box helicase, partial [Planctomycetaceae bacterium]|nr:DEAD/DEAH box helicase [Planctomycetaceae bacterium]
MLLLLQRYLRYSIVRTSVPLDLPLDRRVPPLNSSSRRPRRETSNKSRPRRNRSKPDTGRKPSRRSESSSPKSSSSGFRAFPLDEAILEALDRADYLEPTPIQSQLIPVALEGRDVLGQAQTGTGKTAAFAIPILQRLEGRGKPHRPLALVLTPTRELAVQVRDEFARLADGQSTRIAAAYGGKPIRQQIEKLKRGVDVVVATPGRVLDLMSRRSLDLTDLQFVVLDEADRMLDIGFRPDIERILKRAPRDRQTLLLSATVPPTIERLAQRYMHDPTTLEVSPENVTVETIDQYYFTVEPTRKFELLVKLIERENPRQAIVFCRTKRGTERIYQRLRKQIRGVECIHGDMTQSARDRVMKAFRAGKVQFLVAT